MSKLCLGECALNGIETECEPYGEVDIGVGVMQGGPWGCPVCHWVEPDGCEEFAIHDVDCQCSLCVERPFE